MISEIFWIFGFLWILELLLCAWTFTKCLIFKGNINKYGKNSWALITACTDGIGKGFAISLAKKGYNLVQVGRNLQKLQNQAQDLNKKYGIKVLNIVAEFSSCFKDPQFFYKEIKSQTEGLDISIIINNIGTGKGKLFTSNEKSDLIDTLALNVFPIVFLSRIFLEDLQRRKLGGLVINVSSIMAEILVKKHVMYSSTKSFGLLFSDVLAAENRNLDVMCLQPGFVDTPLTRGRKDMQFLINIEECAEATLRQVGSSSNTSGHWKHVIAILIVKLYRPFVTTVQQFIDFEDL